MTINHSLIFKTTRIQKHFPLSVFVFIYSLVVSASQDVGGHTLSHQNNLTFGIGLLVVGVRTLFGRSLRHNQIFLLFILTMGLRRVRFARESSAKNLYRFPYRRNRWRLEMWLSVLYITRREDFLSHFSDQLFDEPTLSTVQHKSTREKPRTVKFSREILNQSEILSL